MEQRAPRQRIRRRLAVAGSAAVLTGAGAAGVVALRWHTVQAAAVSAPAPVAADPVEGTTAPAADTDNLQQGDQSGAPDTTGAANAAGTSAAAAAGTEPASTEADAAGGNADPAGSAGQDGNFNN